MNLFLVPASQENISRTVVSSVSIDTARQYLTSSHLDALQRALRGRKSFNCWAMSESLKPTFDRMQIDDAVLMTIKRTGAFNFIARIIHKLESEKLGDALWDYTPGRPWKLIYVLDDVVRININKSTLVSALGYDPGYAVAGAIRVRDEYLDGTLARHGSVQQFIRSLS